MYDPDRDARAVYATPVTTAPGYTSSKPYEYTAQTAYTSPYASYEKTHARDPVREAGMPPSPPHEGGSYAPDKPWSGGEKRTGSIWQGQRAADDWLAPPRATSSIKRCESLATKRVPLCMPASRTF